MRRVGQVLEKIQDNVSDDISTLPLLQGKQIAVTGTDVDRRDTRCVVQVPHRAAH